MNTFQKIVSLGAAMGTIANAVCPLDRAFDCINFEEMQEAVATYASDYSWRFYTALTEDDYMVRMFRFLGDWTGSTVPNQWTKGPVLLVNTATKDCRSWFIDTMDENQDSIPKMLFDEGYDVWIACKRGSIYSWEHETPFDSTLLNDTDEQQRLGLA